ncbi:MAG: FAD:protein FMN transferase [Clostridiales bacterium]|nr:FAD:protein FMN transferase [Clostridiales bacterium]
MKRLFGAIVIVALLLSVAVGCLSFSNGNFAHAETGKMSYSFDAGNRTVTLVSITDGHGNVVGVRFSGYYFGESGIPVMADVYSSGKLAIDFSIGEDESKLSKEQIETRKDLVELFSDISQMIDRVDGYANTTYDGRTVGDYTYPTSDVYRYNQAKHGDTMEISQDTYQMLSLAREMYDVTGGAFNPAVYRLVDLWGFSSRIYSQGNFGLKYDRVVTADEFFGNGYPLPDEKYIDAFSNPAFTDFSQKSVTLEQINDKYYVTKNVAPAVVQGDNGDELYEQWIDLGGIAKGYAVDIARQMIANYRDYGIDCFNVDAGSSSMAFGWGYDGKETTLSMSNAFDPLSAVFPTPLFDVKVGKASISTSGQNIRQYTVDGVEYAHILDGVTGAPAQTGVRSVMVVVPEEAGEFWATKGDCLTTALTVMGRDRIVDFVNGYLQGKGIKIVVQYETLDGRKQLLSNYSEGEVQGASDSYSEFGWALKQDGNGKFYYDANAKFDNPVDVYTVLLIVLGSVLGAAAIALVVYHFVRGKKRVVSNVQNAKKDKPFKVLDVMVYLIVVLLILVLFAVFVFDTDSTQLQIVNVIDDETGETLVVYNVTRGEYSVNDANSNGWTIQVENKDNGVEITLTREIKGEEHFNKMKIVRGRNPSVQMIDSICGFHKDCVRNFPSITRSGGAIVCSPNRLKIVTE